MTQDCIFCRIASGAIPATIVYQDESVTAFRDLNPQAPVHVLVIPNRHIESLAALPAKDAALAGHLLTVAHKAAQLTGVDMSGYRVVFNVGSDAGMSVFHLHAHVLGGRSLAWPPG